MLEHFISRRSTLNRIRTAESGEYLCRLAEQLHAQGYSRGTGRVCLREARKFLAWLKAESVPLQAAGKSHVEVYLLSRMTVTQDGRRIPFPTLVPARAGAMHLLRVLRAEFPDAPLCRPPTQVEASVAAFREHLRSRCGLSERTMRERIALIQRFLVRFFGEGPLDIGRLNGSQIMEYVAEQARLHKLQSASHLATGIRSYFRFLQFQGIHVAHLVWFIPRVARPARRFSSTPALTEGQARALLDCFDVTRPTGQRDLAMVLCMLDLGIRACDVSALVLADIDWHRGIIRVPNVKTHRPYQLPLPQRVGRAIAFYVRKGRPRTGLQEVFLRHLAPVKRLDPSSIRSAVGAAYVRAGLPETWHGCHILRRTAATRMHRQGVPLKEIADVLGHQSIDTTVNYLRLDPASLAKVALPWPEERP